MGESVSLAMRLGHTRVAQFDLKRFVRWIFPIVYYMYNGSFHQGLNVDYTTLRPDQLPPPASHLLLLWDTADVG